MEIFETRIWKVIKVSVNHCGFVSGCRCNPCSKNDTGKTEKRKDIYVAFLDLEKALNRVPLDPIVVF